ncbi:MAG TPA: hypothetical protein VGE45_06255 [Chloroflexia bacterium]|jgi:hypothetical protein
MALESDKDMHEHNSQIEEEFYAASQEVLSGRTIESVLADYPDHAAELEGMLRLTRSVRAVPIPSLSPQVLATIGERAQAAAQPIKGGPAQVDGVTRRRAGWLSWLTQLSPALRLGAALALLLLVAIGVVLAGLAFSQGQQADAVVSYSGTITRIEAAEWLIDDDTEVVIDAATVIHGRPEVGAQMTCNAVRLPGHERYRAIEVWVTTGPSEPTEPPKESSSNYRATS